ncbi:hypothetical protein [Dyadobacter luticola]|uniref:CBM-cenC domain-containing protein n=1 Tax=Dyadobacter luticola TaxID=1979387 RepID=A0A5R9L4R4_9BACT|nr:hypothetical protein [Dyadobacter luticola]TLV03401.1 hypothetical protein FEN17_07290 [Dyadobacter luticola]
MNSLSKISRLGISAVFMGAAMFMSSCSKEEAQAPEPRIDLTSDLNDLDGNAKINDLAPSIPQTAGLACKGCQAVGWTNSNWNANVPTGTSTSTSLWGIAPWIKALRGNDETASFITTSAIEYAGGGARSYVDATIKNLTPGKTYAINVLISTTKTWDTDYVKSAILTITHFNLAPVNYFETNFHGKTGQWIPQTIVFKAVADKAKLGFGVNVAGANVTGYANISVGPNAIKQLD